MTRLYGLALTAIMCVSLQLAPAAHAQSDIAKKAIAKAEVALAKVKKACSADIKSFCPKVSPGEGRLVLCMMAHEEQLSDLCFNAALDIADGVELAVSNIARAANVCQADIDKICGNVEPGEGRIARCLVDNKPKLAKACRAEVVSFEVRMAPADDATGRPSGIPAIDSFKWAVDPEKLGMTAKDYIQGETRAFFSNFIKRSGLNKFYHFQGLSKAEDKWVVSPNNDTIYSVAIVNARDGFTLALPEVGDRFLSVHIIDENHISPFYLYGGGNRKFKASQFATDFVVVGIRTGTTGTPADVDHVLKKLHPKYMIVGANAKDDMKRPDVKKVEKVRAALIPEYDKLPDTFGTMQSRAADVDDWEKFTYVTAGAWGLSKEDNAMYLPYAKPGVKGGVCYTATYQKVPAEAFFFHYGVRP